MATHRSVVEFLLLQLGSDASAKPMFGEYGLYVRERLIGTVCNNTLFLRPTPCAAALLGEHERGSPYPGAKPAMIVLEEAWQDSSRMRRLAMLTVEGLDSSFHALAPKRARAKRASTTVRAPRRRSGL